jgi:hypothetical protein
MHFRRRAQACGSTSTIPRREEASPTKTPYAPVTPTEALPSRGARAPPGTSGVRAGR